MKFQKIDLVRKKFSNEWLIFRVDKVEGSKPITGRLIDHSPDRTFIYKEIAKYNSRYPVFVVYSQDRLPKGYAAAFNINAQILT